MASAEQLRALAIIQREGWNGTSFQVLNDGFSYHFTADSVVAYVDTGTAWVAPGAPIAPRERLAEVADDFRKAAAAAGREVCFFAATSRFLQAAPEWRALLVGEQPLFSPRTWVQRFDRTRSIASQVRRAQAKGVEIRRVFPDEFATGTPLRAAVDAVFESWLASRRLAPMGFLVDLQPFAFSEERRTLVAELNGEVFAVLVAAPIYARRGLLVDFLARRHDAPNGTIEALVDAVMRQADQEGIEVVTLGMAPLAGVGSRRLRFARWVSRPLYDFAGLHAFRQKLRPDAWEPLYLVVPPGTGRWGALLEALRAFARGSLVGFAAASARHLARRWLGPRPPALPPATV